MMDWQPGKSRRCFNKRINGSSEDEKNSREWEAFPFYTDPEYHFFKGVNTLPNLCFCLKDGAGDYRFFATTTSLAIPETIDVTKYRSKNQ